MSSIYDTTINGQPVCRTCTDLVLKRTACLLPDCEMAIAGRRSEGGTSAYVAGFEAESRLSYYDVDIARSRIIVERHPRATATFSTVLHDQETGQPLPEDAAPSAYDIYLVRTCDADGSHVETFRRGTHTYATCGRGHLWEYATSGRPETGDVRGDWLSIR